MSQGYGKETILGGMDGGPKFLRQILKGVMSPDYVATLCPLTNIRNVHVVIGCHYDPLVVVMSL